MQVVQAKVSLDRLTEFLEMEELDPANVKRNAPTSAMQPVVQLDRVVNAWEQEPVVQEVDMLLMPGQLCIVTGPVGSGKSSLLMAILGECPRKSGTAAVNAKQISYAGQVPWIQNASLRDNILFGRPYDEQRYCAVLSVCCLERDVDQLGGDAVEIGEKGLNLSGGQQARVALARACYEVADVYILDDILAAVDAHVAKQIFERCVCGLLSNAAVLLVSQHPEVIAHEHVDSRIVLDGDGKCTVQKGSGRADPSIETLGANIGALAEADETKGEVKQKIDGQLTDAEDREVGKVTWGVYKSYMNAYGGWQVVLFLCIVQTCWQALTIGSDWWLNEWSGKSQQQQTDNMGTYLGLYCGLALGSGLLVLVRTLTIALNGLRATRIMFEQTLDSLLHAPMSWFNANPSGRILNRLSDDQSKIDTSLPFACGSTLATSFSLAGTLGVACVVTKFLPLVLIPAIFVYYRVGQYYLSSSREIQRLQQIAQSPLLSFLSTTIDGVPTLRAFGPSAISRFAARHAQLLDSFSAVYYVNFASNCWFSLRIQLIGATILIAVSVFLCLEHNSLSPGLVGLAFSYGLSVDDGMQSLVQILAWLETSMVSPERLQQYIESPNEAPREIVAADPSTDWPQQGQVSFEDVWFRYKKTGDDVLRGLTFHVQPGQRVGIVGRTGAGKSSLIMALFRVEELHKGRVLVDGVDVATIGLAVLRSRLAIVPQSPVMWKGSLQSNLDPFSQHSEEQLWAVLRKAGLESWAKSIEGGLQYEVSGEGSNLSVGQRQLICMAKVLLRKAMVVVLDEATASLDHASDQALQQTIRSEFKGSTVLTIAHRIDTIVDSDMIIVMDAGEAVELATPAELLSNSTSRFASLAREAGVSPIV